MQKSSKNKSSKKNDAIAIILAVIMSVTFFNLGFKFGKVEGYIEGEAMAMDYCQSSSGYIGGMDVLEYDTFAYTYRQDFKTVCRDGRLIRVEPVGSPIFLEQPLHEMVCV